MFLGMELQHIRSGNFGCLYRVGWNTDFRKGVICMILFKRVTAALTAVTTIAWYIAPPLAQIQESDLFSGVFSGLFAQEVLQVQAEEYEYAGFTYSISDTGAMITGYTGEDTVIVIPETVGDGTSVTEIGERAFYECTALTGVTFPDTLTGIGWDAFYGCTSLTSVTIPESVTFIKSYAFSDCTSLSEIVLSEGLTELGCRVFAKTAIET
ncbi:MAG: leucine-rich repeat domain-containing protein, partial [Ruminococcus sp.]|nr:leucine-rich repeat domain-containing protein [Ruminococcus sp.]